MAAGAIRYGFSYKGSKNIIARKLIDILPDSKRFVDLFGGGFAMSHCALLSGKYSRVLYNEIDSSIVEVVRRYIVNKERISLDWVSREDFFQLKDINSLVALCWSFGNDRTTYLYSREIEPWKKALHYAVVFRDYTLIDEYDTRIKQIIDAPEIAERRLNCRKESGFLYKIIPNAKRLDELPYKYTPKCKPCNTVAPKKDILEFFKINLSSLENLENLTRLERLKSLQSLERLESLERLQSFEMLQSLQNIERLQSLQNIERLQSLQNIERLQSLQITCGSYLDYQYREGDVVYCDPPYENTSQKGYIGNFDSQEFYNWAATRPYKVFFSSYAINDKRFFIVGTFGKQKTYSSAGNTKGCEYLYCNKPNTEQNKPKQTTIFDFLKE